MIAVWILLFIGLFQLLFASITNSDRGVLLSISSILLAIFFLLEERL